MLDIGNRVAGFEIEAWVARGGMAVVYRAREVGLGGRVVALKVIAPELAEDETFRHRFTQESHLAASIDHPNIIPIYAAGEADGQLYLVMRYVDGETLGAVFKDQGPLGPADALAIFAQVAGALDAAHAHELVHRDVKPQEHPAGRERRAGPPARLSERLRADQAGHRRHQCDHGRAVPRHHPLRRARSRSPRHRSAIAPTSTRWPA